MPTSGSTLTVTAADLLRSGRPDDMADTPPHEPTPKRRRTRTPAVRQPNASALSAEPIIEDHPARSAEGAVEQREVRLKELDNERLRDRQGLVRDVLPVVLPVVVLLVLMAVGAKFVIDGLLPAEVYMSFFAGGAVGAGAATAVRRTRR